MRIMIDDHAIIQYLKDLTAWWVAVEILNIPLQFDFVYVLYSQHFLVRVTLTLILYIWLPRLIVYLWARSWVTFGLRSVSARPA